MKKKKTFSTGQQSQGGRLDKAQELGAESSHSNEGVNLFDQNQETRKTRKNNVQPVYQVVRSAMAQFKRQVKRDNESKLLCINAALGRKSGLYPDTLRFWADFRAERDRLVDSTRFCKACKDRGLEPKFVADHIVCEGKAILNKVLRDGILVLGEQVQMFNAPLWEDAYDLYAAGARSTITEEGGDE